MIFALQSDGIAKAMVSPKRWYRQSDMERPSVIRRRRGQFVNKVKDQMKVRDQILSISPSTEVPLHTAI